MKVRVPKKFIRAKLSDLDKKQFNQVLKYSEHLPRFLKSGRGLLLSGPPGVGKTYALVALTKFAVEHCYQSRKRFDYEFVTAASMFDRVAVTQLSHDHFDVRRNMSWVDVYSRVPWLVINDLGKEYRAGQLHDQVIYKLGRILRDRCERELVTHITTNLKPSKGEESIGHTYGESVRSLLSEMVKVYVITGRDRRKKGK